jgi:hypothetical protein
LTIWGLSFCVANKRHALLEIGRLLE